MQEAYEARLAEMRMSPEAVAAYARYADAVTEHVGGKGEGVGRAADQFGGL